MKIILVFLLSMEKFAYSTIRSEVKCDETQFQCLSGDRPCIPAEFENDGDEDCSDGSDENGRRVPIIQPIPVGSFSPQQVNISLEQRFYSEQDIDVSLSPSFDVG